MHTQYCTKMPRCHGGPWATHVLAGGEEMKQRNASEAREAREAKTARSRTTRSGVAEEEPTAASPPSAIKPSAISHRPWGAIAPTDVRQRGSAVGDQCRLSRHGIALPFPQDHNAEQSPEPRSSHSLMPVNSRRRCPREGPIRRARRGASVVKTVRLHRLSRLD